MKEIADRVLIFSPSSLFAARRYLYMNVVYGSIIISKRSAFILLIAANLALLAACAPKRVLYPPLPSVPVPKNYLAALLQSERYCREAYGTVKIKISSPVSTFSTKNIFFFKHPEFFRLEVLGFLSQTALLILADSKTIRLFVPSENRLYQGTSSPENIYLLTGMYLNHEDFLSFLLGHPPVSWSEASIITHQQDGNDYCFTIIDGTKKQRLWINPEKNRVTSYIRFIHDVKEMEFSAEEFADNLPCFLPSKAELCFNRLKTTCTVEYTTILPQDVPVEKFHFSPPASAIKLPLKEFFSASPGIRP